MQRFNIRHTEIDIENGKWTIVAIYKTIFKVGIS